MEIEEIPYPEVEIKEESRIKSVIKILFLAGAVILAVVFLSSLASGTEVIDLTNEEPEQVTPLITEKESKKRKGGKKNA